MEAKQLRSQLAQVQSKLKYTKGVLQQKEKKHFDKYKNNVELLKKYNEENVRLQTNLQNYVKKVKDIKEKLQHVLAAAFEEPKNPRQGKRDSTHSSSSQEEGL